MICERGECVWERVWAARQGVFGLECDSRQDTGLFDGGMAPFMWKPLCGRMLGMPGAEKGLEVKAGLSTQQKQFPAPHLEHSDPSALETDM